MKKMLIKVILFIGVFILCNKVYAYNEYSIGSKVTYNGVEYYVIENNNIVPSDESGSGDVTPTDNKNDNVKVPNTMQKVSVILTMVGVVLMSMGLVILFKNKDKIKNR